MYIQINTRFCEPGSDALKADITRNAAHELVPSDAPEVTVVGERIITFSGEFNGNRPRYLNVVDERTGELISIHFD